MGDRRTVLFLLPSMAGGGSERVCATLMSHLDRTRWQPSLVLLERSGPFLDLIPKDVAVKNIGVGRARKALPALVRTIRAQRPDLVFTTMAHMNLLLALARPFLPRQTALVARESNTASVNLDAAPYPALFRFMLRRLYPVFDRLVCQSRHMERDLHENFGISSDKTVVLTNPVDAAGLQRRAAECPHRLPEGARNLVAVGSLTHQKGFDLLLAALAATATPDLHLTILGDGPLKQELKNLATALYLEGRVTFAGFLDNPAPELAAADLLVLSSRYEGLPNVVLEAQALGTPALAFNCPGGVSEIISEGENGWLVPPQDASALANGMDRHHNHGLHPETVSTSIRKHHLPGMVANAYADLFDDVLRRRLRESQPQ